VVKCVGVCNGRKAFFLAFNVDMEVCIHAFFRRLQILDV